MVTLFSPGNDSFKTALESSAIHGNVVFQPVSCTVSAELGGSWTLSMTCPIDDEGKWKYVVEDAVVVVPSFNGNQAWRLTVTEVTEDGVNASGDPIWYDAKSVWFKDTRPTKMAAQDALDLLCKGTDFSGTTALATTASAVYQYKTLLEIISGDEDNAWINKWGGVPLYDNYEVTMLETTTGDPSFVLRTGRDIMGFTYTTDISSLVTRIYPKAYNGRKLSGTGYVDSSHIDDYQQVYPETITYDYIRMESDFGEDEDQDGYYVCKTQAEMDVALKDACNAEFATGIDRPTVSATVEMMDIRRLPEYAEFKDFETVRLGKTVRIYHRALGYDIDALVTGIEWDCCAECIQSVSIGTPRNIMYDGLVSYLKQAKSIDTAIAAAAVTANSASEAVAAIGTIVEQTATTTSVSSGSITSIASVTLPAGTWTVTAQVQFPSNETGRRATCIGTSSGVWDYSHATNETPAVSGSYTMQNCSCPVTLTERTTFYLTVYQNSGSTMTLTAANCYMRAVQHR